MFFEHFQLFIFAITAILFFIPSVVLAIVRKKWKYLTIFIIGIILGIIISFKISSDYKSDVYIIKDDKKVTVEEHHFQFPIIKDGVSICINLEKGKKYIFNQSSKTLLITSAKYEYRSRYKINDIKPFKPFKPFPPIDPRNCDFLSKQEKESAMKEYEKDYEKYLAQMEDYNRRVEEYNQKVEEYNKDKYTPEEIFVKQGELVESPSINYFFRDFPEEIFTSQSSSIYWGLYYYEN